MQKNNNTTTVIGIIALIVIAVGFAGLLLYDKLDSDKKAQEFEEQQALQRQVKHQKEARIIEELDKVEEVITSEIPGIVCWGDEYMLGTREGTIPDNLEKDLNEDLFEEINKDMRASAALSSHLLDVRVVNNGLGGEDIYTMAARIGAYPILTAEDIELPKGVGDVEISFKTNNDKPVRFVSQKNVKLGECTIEDEPGTVTFNIVSENEYQYLFSKNNPSEPKTVKSGTRMFSAGEETYRDYVLVMFFGENESAPQKDMLEIQKAVVNHQNANRDKYVVVAQTGKGSGYDKAMQKQFGEHYIRIDPYEYDQTDNADAAKLIAQKFKELGYTENIIKAVDSAQSVISEINK